MAGNIDQAYRTATTILSWVNKLIAKGNEKMIPASDVYTASEITFIAGKCDDLAKMMRAIPENDWGDVKNSVNNLRQYKQVLTDAAGRLNIGETAHRISYRMSDRLGWVRFTLEALNRLEQGGGKSAKAAAVVAAAKAVGTAKARPVSPALRSIIARDIVEIRASLQRGYINIKTARHLFGTLDNAYKSGVEAVKVAVDAASAILYYLSKVDGAQMLEPPEEMKGRIQQKLWVIVNSIRESGY